MIYNSIGDVMNYFINYIREEIAPHKHKEYEIIVYINGNGTLHSCEKEFAASPGKIIIIPPETLHSSTSEGEFERIYIRGEFNQIFNLSYPTVILDNSEKEGTLLAKMIYSNRHSNTEYVASLCNSLAHFLLQSMKMDDEISLVVKDIIDTMSNSFYDSDFNIGHMLRQSGYAEDYIRSQIKKITGKTPTDFLTQIRISHACYMIDTYKNSLSLSEIAEKCGYTDYVYFSRRFKQLMKISPRKYMLA